MMTQGTELKHVFRKQAELYDAMVRSVWGDRMVLAMTAAGLASFGMGLLFAEKWRTRYVGAMLYATAAGMELFAAMSPKTREERMRATSEAERPEARAA